MKYLRKFLVCVFVFDTLLFCYIVVSTYRQRRKNNTNLHVVEGELYSSESIPDGDNIEMSEQKTIDSESTVFLKESSSTDEQSSNKMDVSQSEDSLSDEYSNILYKKDNSTLLGGKLNYEFPREGSIGTDVRAIPTTKNVFNLNTHISPHVLYFQKNSDSMNSPMFIKDTETEESNKRKKCAFYHEIIRKSGLNRIKKIENMLEAQKKRLNSIDAQNRLIEQNIVEQETNYTKISTNLTYEQISKYAYSQSIVERKKIHEKILELEKLIKKETARLEKQEKSNLLLTIAQLQEKVIKIIECTEYSELEQIIANSMLELANYKTFGIHELGVIKQLDKSNTNGKLVEKNKAKKELLIKKGKKYAKLICNLNKKKNKIIACIKKTQNEKFRIKHKLNNAHAWKKKLTKQLSITKRKMNELTNKASYMNDMPKKYKKEIEDFKNIQKKERICIYSLYTHLKEYEAQIKGENITNENLYDEESEKNMSNKEEALDDHTIKIMIDYIIIVYSKMKQRIEDLNMQRDELSTQYKNLKNQHANTKEILNQTNNKEQDFIKKLKEKNDEKNDLETELKNKIQNIINLQTKQNDLENAVKLAETEYASLSHQHNIQKSENQLQESNLEAVTNIIKNLTTDLNTPIQKNKEKENKLNPQTSGLQNNINANIEDNDLNNHSTNELKEKNKNLETLLEKLSPKIKTEIDNLKAVIDSMKKEYNEVSAEKSAMLINNASLQKNLQEAEAEIKNIQTDLNTCITEKKNLQSELSEKKNTIDELKSQLNDKNTDINRLESEINKLNGIIEEKTEESQQKLTLLKTNNDVQEALQKKLNAAMGREDEINEKLQSHMQTVNNLNTDISEKTKQIESLEKNLKTQIKENDNDKDSYTKIHKEYQSSLKTIDDLRSEMKNINTMLNNYQTECNKLKDELTIEKKTINDLNSKLETAKFEIQKKKEENSALNEDKKKIVITYIEKVKGCKESAELQQNKLIEEIKHHKEQLVALELKIKSLTDSLNASKAELNEKTNKNQSNLDEITELNNEYRKLETQLTNENNKLESANNNLKTLEDTKIALLDELSDKNKIIDEMSIEIKDLKGLTEHKTSTINTLNASVSNSNLTCDNLNQKIKTMEEDAQKINSQLQENKEKIDTLATEIDDKKNTICKLNTKINEMQTMIDKKNTTNNENDLEIRNLKTKIENLNKDLIKETTRANCAEKNLNTCNDNQVKLQEEIKNLSATIFTNESKNTDVEKQIKVLKENKNTLESSLKTAEKTIKETDKELKENKKTIENLEKSVNDLKETIKTKLTECNNEKTKINNLNKDHKQLIEELSEYKKKIDLSNNQEKSYKEKNTELEKALKEKNTGLDELKCEKENIEKKLDALNDKYNKVYNEHTDLNKNYTHLTKKFDDLEKVLEQKENELLSVKKESTKSENELNNTIKTLQTQFNNEKDKTDKMNTRILNLNNDLNNTRKTLESTQNHLNATNDKLAQLEKEKDQLEEETLNKLEEKANNEKSIPDSIEFIDIQNENMESKVFLSAEDAEVRKFKDMSADKKMKIVYDEILEIQNSLVVEEKHKLVWHHFLLFNTEIMPANSSDVINIGPVSMDPTNWISHLIRHNMMYKEQAAKISYCYFKEYNSNSILNVYKQLPKIYKNDTNKKPHAIVLENMVRYCTTLHEFLELTSKFIFLETDTLSKLANDQYQSLLDAKKLNRMGTKHTWSSEMQKHFKDTYNVLLDLYNNWTIIQQNRKQIGREMADSDEKTHTATSSSNEEPILDKYISLDEAVSSLDVFVTHKTPKFKDFKGNFPNTEVIGKTLNFTRTSDMLDGSNRWDLLDQAIRECSQFLSKSNSSSLGNSENQRPSKNIDLMFILFSARPDIKTSFSPLFFLDRSKLIGIVAAILNRLEDCLADFKALTQDTKIYNSILENDLALIQTVRVSMAIHSAAALLQHNILSFQRSKDHFIYNFVYKNLFATSNASVKMIDDSDKNEKNVFKSEMARIINVNPKDLNKTNRKTETRHDPKYIESKIAVKPFGQSQNSEYPEFVWNLIKENAVVDYYLNYSMDHIKKYASSKNMKH